MLPHTLTHEAIIHLYITLAFILNALSNQSIAGLVHARWLVKRSLKVITVSTIFKGLIVVWGFYLIPINMLLNDSSLKYLMNIVIGLMMGYLSMRTEEILIRRYARSHLLKNQKMSVKNNLGSLISAAVLEPTRLQLSSNKSKEKTRESGIRRGSNNMLMSSETYHFSFLPLVFTAVFEEFIFRGFLLVLCFELHSPILVTIAIVCVSLIFSFSHFNFGTLQVTLKIIFSFCMLACVLITGNLITAICAHLCFNILTWRYLKGRSMINTRHMPEQVSILG